MQETLNRLTKVFRDVFEREDLQISAETSAEDIDNWDSLTHVTLMIKVERTFGVRFSSSEVARLQTVGELTQLIETRLAR